MCPKAEKPHNTSEGTTQGGKQLLGSWAGKRCGRGGGLALNLHTHNNSEYDCKGFAGPKLETPPCTLAFLSCYLSQVSVKRVHSVSEESTSRHAAGKGAPSVAGNTAVLWEPAVPTTSHPL